VAGITNKTFKQGPDNNRPASWTVFISGPARLHIVKVSMAGLLLDWCF